jgi:hypothetical protein
MRSALFALVTIVLCSAPALGGVPSATESDVDPCIITCPAGDSVFTAIIRHADRVPWDHVGDAELDLCGCPNLHFGPVAADGPYTFNGCTVHTMTDVDGNARFPLAAGGVCSGTSIPFYVEGLLIRTLSAVASFDQNGDLAVTAADLAIIQSKAGTADRTADFDCDGIVTSNDYNIAAAHLGHHDASVVGIGDGPEAGFGARPAPNPSHGPVDFVIRTPARGRATLALFDLTGRRLATLLDREIEPGAMRVGWSGRDPYGRAPAAGLYFYRFTVGAERAQGLLVIAR